MANVEHIAKVIADVLSGVDEFHLLWAHAIPILTVGRFQILWEREHYKSGREMTMIAFRWTTRHPEE